MLEYGTQVCTMLTQCANLCALYKLALYKLCQHPDSVLDKVSECTSTILTHHTMIGHTYYNSSNSSSISMVFVQIVELTNVALAGMISSYKQQHVVLSNHD